MLFFSDQEVILSAARVPIHGGVFILACSHFWGCLPFWWRLHFWGCFHLLDHLSVLVHLHFYLHCWDHLQFWAHIPFWSCLQFRGNMTTTNLQQKGFLKHIRIVIHGGLWLSGFKNLVSVVSKILDNLPLVKQMRLGRRPSLQTELKCVSVTDN